MPISKGDNLLSVSTESQVRNSVECNSKCCASISKSKSKPCKQAIKHREHRGLFYRSSHSLQSGTSPLRKLLSQPAPKRALSSFTYLVWNPFDPTAAGQADPNRLHNAWRQPHKTWPAHQRLQLPGLGADELQDLSQSLGGTSTMNFLSSETLSDAKKLFLTVDAQKQRSLGD
jgi:hypothetical protein